MNTRDSGDAQSDYVLKIPQVHRNVPLGPPSEHKVDKIDESVYCYYAFGNVGFVITDEGVVVVDTSSYMPSKQAYAAMRGITDKPVRYIIYTHGHLDHAGRSAQSFLEAGTEVIGHENVKERFDRYRAMPGWIRRLGAWQYAGELLPRGDLPAVPGFLEMVYPTIMYSREYTFKLGGLTFELFHAKGETDDGTVVWIPEMKIVFAGDLLIGGFPNIGNPLKVIRYEREWYESLDRILALDPEVVVPGHGAVVRGPQKIREVLEPTSEVMRYLYEEVIRHLNLGSTVEQMLEEIPLPQHLAENPHIRTIHGCREYTIRGAYRRYAGWLDDMNAANLFPSRPQEVANLLSELCSGHERMLGRVKELLAEGRCQLGLHLVDLVIEDDPQNKEAHLLKAQLLEEVAEEDRGRPVFLARNMYLGQAAYERKLAE